MRKVIVDDDAIKLRFVRQFFFGLCKTFLNHLGRSISASFEPFTQFLNGGRTDKDRRSLVTQDSLEVQSAFDIHIKENLPTGCFDTIDLFFEGTIVEAFIDLFKLDEVIMFDAFLELFDRDEVILFAIHFLSTRRARGAGNREL